MKKEETKTRSKDPRAGLLLTALSALVLIFFFLLSFVFVRCAPMPEDHRAFYRRGDSWTLVLDEEEAFEIHYVAATTETFDLLLSRSFLVEEEIELYFENFLGISAIECNGLETEHTLYSPLAGLFSVHIFHAPDVSNETLFRFSLASNYQEKEIEVHLESKQGEAYVYENRSRTIEIDVR